MSAAKQDPEVPEQSDDEPEAVDLDLEELDPELREALRKPSAVRLPGGGKPVTIPHIADWPAVAARYTTAGLFDAWAEEVMSEPDAQAFKDAKLRNYQIDRIIKLVTDTGGISPGKSSASSRSRGGTRPK
jgi:hypothetical protein